MKKKLVFALVVLLSFSSMLLWSAGTEEEVPEGPVEIVYWRALSGTQGETQDELVALFNESQDEVHVEAQYQGSYVEVMQKVMAAIAAGNLPDVVLLDSPFVTLLGKDDILMDLTKFAENDTSDFDLDDYIPGFIGDCYYDNTLYALPVCRSTPMLYINADMFEAAGLPRRAPETWDELREFSKKLTKFDELGQPIQQGVRFTLGQSTAHWYFQAGLYSFGGQVSDEDFNLYLTEDPAVEMATFWQDMVFKDKSALPSTSSSVFFDKKVGMTFSSTGSYGNYLGRADFEVIPAFVPKQLKNAVPVGGSVLSITSTDERRQEGAWKFIKFMTSPEANYQIISKTGYLPVTKSAMEYPDIVKFYEDNPLHKIAADQLEFAQPQASVIALGMGKEILRQMLEKILIGDMDVRTVMEETETALLKEYNESFK